MTLQINCGTEVGDQEIRGGVMAIVPTVRCSSMRKSFAFYTNVLDFERIDGDDDLVDPCYTLRFTQGWSDGS